MTGNAGDRAVNLLFPAMSAHRGLAILVFCVMLIPCGKSVPATALHANQRVSGADSAQRGMTEAQVKRGAARRMG